MTSTWYETIEADVSLTQGDLVFDCPIITWSSSGFELGENQESQVLQRMSVAISADVVVMTQACDLMHEKVSNVIVCPHTSLTEYKASYEEEMKKQNQNLTVKAWRSHCNDISDGFVWNLSMLNKGDEGQISIEHRIVDFRDVYTVPGEFLKSLLTQRSKPRLRLLPPYREHLSQAFARFFMRVGLPTPVHKLW